MPEKHFDLRHTHFLKAVEDHDIESVQSLLDEGKIDANLTQNRIGPLYQAVSKGHTKIVRLLLAREETNVNIVCRYGDTPLHIAAQRGDREIFQMLLDQKDIDINVANKNRETPLHMAVYRNDPEMVSMLLARTELNVNAKNDAGNTPLHIAMQFECYASANQLLATAGIDLNIMNDDNLSPLSRAMIAPKSQQTIQFLLIHRATIVENVQRVLLAERLEPSHKSLFIHVLLAGLDIGVYPEREETLSTCSEPKVPQMRAHNFLTREDFQNQVRYGEFFNVGKHCFEYQKLSRARNPVPLKEKGCIEEIEYRNVFYQLQAKSKLLPECILPIIEEIQNEQINSLAQYCEISRPHSKQLYYALSEPNRSLKPSYLYPERFSKDCFRLVRSPEDVLLPMRGGMIAMRF